MPRAGSGYTSEHYGIVVRSTWTAQAYEFDLGTRTIQSTGLPIVRYSLRARAVSHERGVVAMNGAWENTNGECPR
jgi:hypothetical protein